MNAIALMDRSAAFTHDALLYTGQSKFLERVGGFVHDGISAGEPTLVVLSNPKIDLLRDNLPQPDRAEFLDMERVGRNPGRIMSVWHDFVERHSGREVPLRGVGEPVWQGRTHDELEECELHEHLLNVAFELSSPWWLLCPYDSTALSTGVLDKVGGTHRRVLPSDGADLQGDYSPRDAAWEIFRSPLPPSPPAKLEVTFDSAGLATAREAVSRVATEAGLGDRAGDFVLSVNEVATNSIVHGGGRGRLRLWEAESALVCEVADHGTIQDPLVGRRRPSIGDLGRQGLWVANQFCDFVQIRSRSDGTVVRLHMRA